MSTTGDTMKIGMGLDTGGTYTDAVILNLEDNTVIQSAKALTTRVNLVRGIENAIRDFDDKILSEVSIVSLSSTLATNSVVEGRGCRVGLICIGYDYNGSIVVDEYIKINGKHDVNGRETESLDIDSVKSFLKRVGDRIDCVAITGYMSVRNPEHEMKVGELVKELIDKPTVCGYQLSSTLGFNERTVTAVMNAKLIPVIKDLIKSVYEVISEHGINAPIMIVKGDGSLMNTEMAEERPVETILCGPAASITGAKVLSGLGDAIVIDMGGTTTDIGILRNGFPTVNQEGAVIGGYRTHVLAAEIFTSGIGGDSHIFLNGNDISVKPQRVIPLCIAAYEHPEIIDDLYEARSEPKRCHKVVDDRNAVSDIEFFIASKSFSGESLSLLDIEFLGLIKSRPLTLAKAASILNASPLDFDILRMERYGLIQRIGFTPTDVLHVEGSYVEYDAKASELGIDYMCVNMNTDRKTLIGMIKELIYRKITYETLTRLVFEESHDLHRPMCSELIEKAVTGVPGVDYDCIISLNKPIIGIGAPVRAWLPEVARRLHTSLIVPENSMIGNAIGAISGCISESISILIEPKGICSDHSGPCMVFSKMGRMGFDSINNGIEYAKAEGAKYVDDLARSAGACLTDLTYDVKERVYDLDEGKAILDIQVLVTATGKPPQMA